MAEPAYTNPEESTTLEAPADDTAAIEQQQTTDPLDALDSTEGTDESPESADEEPTAFSFADLAEQLEGGEASLFDLRVPVKVDGLPAEATLKDLVNSYQMQEAAENRLSSAKAKAQELTSEAQQQADAAKQQVGTAAGLVQLAEQLFLSDVKQANLAELREKDPQKYLVEKDRLTERRRVIDAAKQQIGQQLIQYMNTGPTQEQIAEQNAKLIEKMPALADEKAANQLYEYITKTHEFTDEEIQAFPDHRLYVLAEKARLYDELETKAAARAKTAQSKPMKVLKPGKPAKPVEKLDRASILYGKKE